MLERRARRSEQYVQQTSSSRVHYLCNELLNSTGGEKRRKPYFRFDARAAFEVTMVTG